MPMLKYKTKMKIKNKTHKNNQLFKMRDQEEDMEKDIIKIEIMVLIGEERAKGINIKNKEDGGIKWEKE
jgi:hypothetical protein